MLPRHVWPNSVKHDVFIIRRRTKATRRIAKYVASAPNTVPVDLSDIESPHSHLWIRVTTPLNLNTAVSLPVRNLEALCLTNSPDDDKDTN